MKKNMNINGFTMVEMLMAASIGALVIYFVAGFFTSSQEVQKVREAKEDVLNDLSLATSSINSAAMGLYVPPEKVVCAKSAASCAELVGENPINFKKEYVQFGYKCIKPSKLISNMNSVRPGLAVDVLKEMKKRCPVNCGAGSLPALVRYYKEEGKSWEETQYPMNNSEMLTSTIATASCASLDKTKKTLKLRLVGIYLNKNNKFKPVSIVQSIAIPYFNLTDSLNILK